MSNTLRNQLLHGNNPEEVRGFLTQVWESTPSLPMQSPADRVRYFLERGVETLLALPLSNLFSTLTVAFSLALVAGFFLLLSNVERTLSDLGSSLTITAYLSNDSRSADTEALLRRLKAVPGVQRVEYTSPASALENFREALGDRAKLLGRFDGRNPLPGSFDIQLERQSRELHTQVVEALENAPIVTEVSSGNDVFEKVSGLLSAIKIVGTGGGIFLFGVVLFLILNTVKLVIFSQREEIEIMQLVGATEATVRTPFLVAGAIQGFFGGVVGVVVLRLLFGVVRSSLEGSSLFGAALPLPYFFSTGAIVMFLLAATVLGVAASALAVGRHLDI